MKFNNTSTLLLRRIAESPAARKELAAALASGDPVEVERVVEALGGGKLCASRPPSPSGNNTSPSGPMYFT